MGEGFSASSRTGSQGGSITVGCEHFTGVSAHPCVDGWDGEDTDSYEERTQDFDYVLPPECIAQTPLVDRTAARLLVFDRQSGTIEHRHIRDLPEILRSGDLIVLNDTRVIPARLRAMRPSGGQVEVLLLHPIDGPPGVWAALIRRSARLRIGERLTLLGSRQRIGTGGGTPTLSILRKYEGGEFDVAFDERTDTGSVLRLLEEYGKLPLPPYIRSPLADGERYQTVYAKRDGSVAAPTAGLHFTPELLRTLAAHGVPQVYLTLHVGAGTFRPVRAERIAEHRMHQEWFELGAETAVAIQRTRLRGGRVVAVGTTVTRVLETQTGPDGTPRAGSGWTELFIRPGYRFTGTDALLTNFHLPRSTLLMLVAAFAGRERILAAYHEALHLGYRFYSFGDAMLLL